MITKQQALEFIYELSKLHVIHLDIPCGYTYIDKEEDEYRAWADNHTLEAIVTEIIKGNMGNALLMDFNKIPVDVDMLEVGQTYKVELDDFYNGCHSVHIVKYIGKKEEYYYFENQHTWRYEKKDLYQLWKMNKKENEKGIVDKNA